MVDSAYQPMPPSVTFLQMYGAILAVPSTMGWRWNGTGEAKVCALCLVLQKQRGSGNTFDDFIAAANVCYLLILMSSESGLRRAFFFQ